MLCYLSLDARESILAFLFSRRLCTIVLKKLGRIGGDDARVRARLKHILSKIDSGIDFTITDVRVRGASSRPPIYEVTLDDEDDAETLRKSFSRFTRKKNPITRPAELDGVEIYNCATLATRVRISILRVGSFSAITLFVTVLLSFMVLVLFVCLLVCCALCFLVMIFRFFLPVDRHRLQEPAPFLRGSGSGV